jgi:hypothetical protein
MYLMLSGSIEQLKTYLSNNFRAFQGESSSPASTTGHIHIT